MTVYSSALSNGAVCDTTCREIWKDDRTGLLWSDEMPSASDWCKASGNSESSACANNQPIAQSWCAEVGPSSMVQVNGSGEDWVNGTYTAAKGGMGRTTSISIRWRLPTKYDFQAADINGYRMVTFNKAFNNVVYHEFWLATDQLVVRGFSIVAKDYSNAVYNIRCVGR